VKYPALVIRSNYAHLGLICKRLIVENVRPTGRASNRRQYAWYGRDVKVNGQMFAGLFARGAVVKLSEPDQKAALAIDGALMFDPMGNGRVMRDTVFLPESVMAEPDELRAWIRKGLEFTADLPAKKKRPATKTVAVKKTSGRKTKSKSTS
jgi:hypothetical protein